MKKEYHESFLSAMNAAMKALLFLLLLPLLTYGRVELEVPRITEVNAKKLPFIQVVSALSRALQPEGRSAVAPFGGVKLTPFLELDLTELIIITNSFPGTPGEIENQFTRGREKLRQVLSQALRSGAMSTEHVLSVNTGAQLLSRLRLELGVSEAFISYWAPEDSPASSAEDFRDRRMEPQDSPLATVFEFNFRGRPSRLIFISAFILPEGLPKLFHSYLPPQGLDWIYLSADGLGHFSANRNNGLSIPDRQLLDSLTDGGAVLLDYPTDPNYHRPQTYGGITFMDGRLPLEELGLTLLQTLPVETPGIFGYCLRAGDEVRIYRKAGKATTEGGGELRMVGERHHFILK